MENEEIESLPKNALKSGLIIGLINAFLLVFMYVFDPTLFTNWKMSLLILVINIGLLIYFGLTYRKSIGNIISFGDAFKHGFITLATAGLIGLIFRILLFNVIDPDLTQTVTDSTIEMTVEMLQGFGMSDSDIDKSIEEIRANAMESFSVFGMIKQYGWSLIVFAIVSLISGLIVKRDEPI